MNVLKKVYRLWFSIRDSKLIFCKCQQSFKLILQQSEKGGLIVKAGRYPLHKLALKVVIGGQALELSDLLRVGHGRHT